MHQLLSRYEGSIIPLIKFFARKIHILPEMLPSYVKLQLSEGWFSLAAQEYGKLGSALYCLTHSSL